VKLLIMKFSPLPSYIIIKNSTEKATTLGITMERRSCVGSERWASDVGDNKIKLNFELETRL
jgi:hypothetical protein